MKKKGNEKMHIPRHKVTHIPTSFTVPALISTYPSLHLCYAKKSCFACYECTFLLCKQRVVYVGIVKPLSKETSEMQTTL